MADRNAATGFLISMQILMEVPECEWREPSQAQPKDQFGGQSRRLCRLTARLNDGHIRWRGWFESPYDADAFLWALTLYLMNGTPVPRELWRLPTPAWHPDIGEGATYDFAKVIILSSPTNTLLTMTSPRDWNNGANTVDALSGGGESGGTSTSSATRNATGGGGSEWRRLTNFLFVTPGTSSALYQIAAVSGQVTLANANHTGGTGNKTWFNGTSWPASLGPAPGIGGNFSTVGGGGGISGGAGGTGGVGGVGNAGGRGGNTASIANHIMATGGGGAGGQNGAGGNGGDITSADGSTNGGAGDAGFGGAGGIARGGTGGAGSEPASAGGGGAGYNGVNAVGGSGGSWGGGGGGAVTASPSGATTGRGNQGIIVILYTPAVEGFFLFS